MQQQIWATTNGYYMGMDTQGEQDFLLAYTIAYAVRVCLFVRLFLQNKKEEAKTNVTKGCTQHLCKKRECCKRQRNPSFCQLIPYVVDSLLV